jgi:hypothetical protein
MNEEALRALVREAVTRHLGGQTEPPSAPSTVRLTVLNHPSHYRFTNLPESDGPCIIEPSVACNHCGYCQSHGH